MILFFGIVAMICIFELIITHRSFVSDDNVSSNGRLPLPDIHWPLRNNVPDIARPKRFYSCPFYQINYNSSRQEENLLVSDCYYDNADERTFAFRNVDYVGKQITVYAPGHYEEVYFGDFCNVEIKNDAAFANQADIVLIKTQIDHELFQSIARPSKQIWVMHFMESPDNTKNVSIFNGQVNYTASYRSDADIVTKYDKPNAAVWIASNCWTSNSRRQLADQLSFVYKTDMFGKCGHRELSDTDFIEALRNNYRYYLSFENSNCDEYITEKVFKNAFFFDLIPIVYGASKADYEKALPPNSYIYYGDFESAQDLAEYLHKIDEDQLLYETFFEWKKTYTVSNYNLYERLCSLYDFAPQKVYLDINAWWNSKPCKHIRLQDLWSKETRQ
uniref:Fucosyltransferase n=1 Tax=Panagrolaimus sp. ES5 TaxID=591445 RepID=A0AC34F602_9BILA